MLRGAFAQPLPGSRPRAFSCQRDVHVGLVRARARAETATKTGARFYLPYPHLMMASGGTRNPKSNLKPATAKTRNPDPKMGGSEFFPFRARA